GLDAVAVRRLASPMRCLLAFATLSLVACGARPRAAPRPNEDGDEQIGAQGSVSAFSREGTRPADASLDGSEWVWTDAHCTEGPLDLSIRGFEQQLRVKKDGDDLLLLADQVFTKEGCRQLVVHRATREEENEDWSMVEETRLSFPPTEECRGQREKPLPGEVRLRGDRLEVLVQRSKVWCDGLEVQMGYKRAESGVASPEEIVRRYALHMNRMDADSLAALYAAEGSVLDPYTRTDTDAAARFDGRPAVLDWYRRAFSGAEWVTFQVNEILKDDSGEVKATWSYMDSRLPSPLHGETRFKVAAGEIFESETRVLDGYGASPASE
ncbi:MAG: hypothetical protein KC416_16945, partial [Myxococcales bacterium]|nr:hypothetical protein [Myxococcales bacterium]